MSARASMWFDTIHHRLRSRALAVGALLTMAACEAPTATRAADAYDPTTLTNGVLYRWVNGTTIRVYVAGAAASGFDLALATRQALVRWNAVPQFAEFALEMTGDVSSADVVIYDRVSDAPALPGSCAFDARSAAGYTYFCPASTTPATAELLPLASGASSRVRVMVRVDKGRVSSQSAYNAVVAHEFGHVLGIGAHSDLATDLMFGLPTVETPSARDIATLRSLLGRVPGLSLN